MTTIQIFNIFRTLTQKCFFLYILIAPMFLFNSAFGNRGVFTFSASTKKTADKFDRTIDACRKVKISDIDTLIESQKPGTQSSNKCKQTSENGLIKLSCDAESEAGIIVNWYGFNSMEECEIQRWTVESVTKLDPTTLRTVLLNGPGDFRPEYFDKYKTNLMAEKELEEINRKNLENQLKAEKEQAEKEQAEKEQAEKEQVKKLEIELANANRAKKNGATHIIFFELWGKGPCVEQVEESYICPAAIICPIKEFIIAKPSTSGELYTLASTKCKYSSGVAKDFVLIPAKGSLPPFISIGEYKGRNLFLGIVLTPLFAKRGPNTQLTNGFGGTQNAATWIEAKDTGANRPNARGAKIKNPVKTGK